VYDKGKKSWTVEEAINEENVRKVFKDFRLCADRLQDQDHILLARVVTLEESNQSTRQMAVDAAARAQAAQNKVDTLAAAQVGLDNGEIRQQLGAIDIQVAQLGTDVESVKKAAIEYSKGVDKRLRQIQKDHEEAELSLQKQLDEKSDAPVPQGQKRDMVSATRFQSLDKELKEERAKVHSLTEEMETMKEMQQADHRTLEGLLLEVAKVKSSFTSANKKNADASVKMAEIGPVVDGLKSSVDELSEKHEKLRKANTAASDATKKEKVKINELNKRIDELMEHNEQQAPVAGLDAKMEKRISDKLSKLFTDKRQVEASPDPTPQFGDIESRLDSLEASRVTKEFVTSKVNAMRAATIQGREGTTMSGDGDPMPLVVELQDDLKTLKRKVDKLSVERRAESQPGDTEESAVPNGDEDLSPLLMKVGKTSPESVEDLLRYTLCDQRVVKRIGCGFVANKMYNWFDVLPVLKRKTIPHKMLSRLGLSQMERVALVSVIATREQRGGRLSLDPGVPATWIAELGKGKTPAEIVAKLTKIMAPKVTDSARTGPTYEEKEAAVISAMMELSSYIKDTLDLEDQDEFILSRPSDSTLLTHEEVARDAIARLGALLRYKGGSNEVVDKKSNDYVRAMLGVYSSEVVPGQTVLEAAEKAGGEATAVAYQVPRGGSGAETSSAAAPFVRNTNSWSKKHQGTGNNNSSTPTKGGGVPSVDTSSGTPNAGGAARKH
jgi:hypothetical protein